MLQEFSALAYKRDNQMKKAEEGYIRALHFRRRAACQGGCAWDLNEHITTGLLTKFLFMIDTLNEDLGPRTVRFRDGGEGAVYPVFVALLLAAGFQAKEGGLSHRMVLEMGPVMVPFLKGAIRNNRKKALTALVAASDRPEKALFYKEIAECAAPNAVFQIGGGSQNRNLTQDRLEAIQDARKQNEVTAAIRVQVCGYERCESRNGPSTSMKSCPCKTRSYCSKE